MTTPTSSANLFSSGGGGEAITEAGAESVGRVGRSNVKRSRDGLYPGMDLKRALMKPVDVFVTADNCMADAEAGRMTRALMNRCGIATEQDEYMVAFIKSMCLCMAVNSSSVLVPGRAKFYVGTSEFDFYSDVMAVLGNDARRYFRAYADATSDYLKEVIDLYRSGPQSEDAEDMNRYHNIEAMYANIMLVAERRGLTRVPHLIHDSAEFCSDKNVVERTYVLRSKENIFSNMGNMPNLVDNPVVARSQPSRAPGAVTVSGGNVDGLPNDF